MASKKLAVDLEFTETSEFKNFKTEAIDVTDTITNPPSFYIKRVVYWNGYYYYSNGTSWLQLGVGTGGVDPIFVEGTGVHRGGQLSVGTPNTTFSISDGEGAVTANTTGTQTYTPVSWSGLTNIPATYIGSGLVSYVGINSAGAVVQQLAPFTQAQTRDIIVLGSLIHVNLLNLDNVNNFQNTILSPANLVSDVSKYLGIFNVTGNVFSANGSNLNINKSAGSIYSFGSNFGTNPKDPSKVTLNALTALTFQYRLQNGTNGATGINIDPNNYDVAGVITSVPTNKFTVQRIYSFVSNNVKIQYGQTLYNSLSEARASISTESFVTESSISQNGLLRGFLIVQQGTTNLTTTTNAQFLEASKFGQASSSGGGGSSSVAILDEGVLKTSNVSSMDFVGAGVTVTNVGDAVTVTISGGGGGGSSVGSDIYLSNNFI